MFNLLNSFMLITNLFILSLLMLKKTNNPMNFGLFLISYVMICSLMMGTWKMYYLYSLIFYISMISGLLIMMLYFISIISNEPTKFKYFLDIIIMFFPLSIIIMNFKFYNLWTLDTFKISYYNSSLWTSFQFLYSSKFNHLMIFMMIYLLIILFFIMKISLTNKKSLRQWALPPKFHQ